MRRSCLGMVAAAMLMPLLLAACFIGWSGLEARRAFNNGALDRPVWCVDRALLREEQRGRVSNMTINRGLMIQVVKHEGLLDHYNLFRQLRSAGWQWAISSFWSDASRRAMFNELRGRMALCTLS
jgi:hypothetical protein